MKQVVTNSSFLNFLQHNLQYFSKLFQIPRWYSNFTKIFSCFYIRIIFEEPVRARLCHLPTAFPKFSFSYVRCRYRRSRKRGQCKKWKWIGTKPPRVQIHECRKATSHICWTVVRLNTRGLMEKLWSFTFIPRFLKK